MVIYVGLHTFSYKIPNYLFIKTIQKRKQNSHASSYHPYRAYSALYSKVDRITGSGYLTKLEDTQVDLKGNLKSLKSEAPR